MCMGREKKKASEIPTAVGAGSKYAWILTSLLMAQKWNKYECIEKHFQSLGKWNLFLYRRGFIQFYNEISSDSGLQTSFVFKHFPLNILSRTYREHT